MQKLDQNEKMRQNSFSPNTRSISVIIPVYRWDPFLPEAIDSIVNQTLPPNEIIVICDEPDDETKEFLRDVYSKDIRIIQIFNPTKIGIAESLNIGISLSKSEYIARMDADDISLPFRFEKQISFLEKNKKVGVCGTSIKTIGKLPEMIYRFPLNNDQIKVKIFWGWAIAHPTVIFRSSVLKSMDSWYDPTFDHCEDYEFWSRLKKFTDMGNLHEVMLQYRIHEKNICSIYYNQQKKLDGLVREKC